jgi:hypothetical protein
MRLIEDRIYAVRPFTDNRINHGGTEGTEKSIENSNRLRVSVVKCRGRYTKCVTPATRRLGSAPNVQNAHLRHPVSVKHEGQVKLTHTVWRALAKRVGWTRCRTMYIQEAAAHQAEHTAGVLATPSGVAYRTRSRSIPPELPSCSNPMSACRPTAPRMSRKRWPGTTSWQLPRPDSHRVADDDSAGHTTQCWARYGFTLHPTCLSSVILTAPSRKQHFANQPSVH